MVSCTDGRAAAAEIARRRFALVVAAAKLPGLDGFEIVQRMRSTPATAETPAVLLAWPGNEEDIARAFELGADDFIEKPFSPIELTARLRRLMRPPADS